MLNVAMNLQTQGKDGIRSKERKSHNPPCCQGGDGSLEKSCPVSSEVSAGTEGPPLPGLTTSHSLCITHSS